MSLMNKELVLFRARRALLLIGPSVSLLVAPWTNYDPISCVKVLALSSITFFVGSLVFSLRSELFSRISKWLPILSALFIAMMISTMIFSGAPLTQQIWGMFGRNTGFVTYLSLVLVALFTALLSNQGFLRNICWSLIYTSVAATAYAIIQVLRLDPIRWSEMRPFATFGNINFSSAFFGMAALVSVIVALDKNLAGYKRVALFVLAVTDIAIIQTTDSIQGVMIFGAGITLAPLLFLLKSRKLRLLSIPYGLLALGGLYFVILGLLNKGFLAKILYQPSVVFRTDYMHAGYEMTLKRPIFGVGLDSYGDWYRTLRGLISTTRTSPDRIANTAHNIFLDVSSTGGLPLLAAFLGIILLALLSSIRYFRSMTKWDPIFIAIFCGWIAYQIQALISINQVAVGIWGWLFTGALVGYSNRELRISENLQKRDVKRSKSSNSSFMGRALPIGLAFQTFTMTSVGLVTSGVPVFADAKFHSAAQSAALEKYVEATRLPGITAFHLVLAADAFRQAGLATSPEAKNLLSRLTEEFPRDYYAWRVIAYTDAIPERKSEALAKLRELDPFNPENQ